MERGGKSNPNKADSMLVKKNKVFYSQFCGQEPLMDNKMFTELLHYGRHMAQDRAQNRNSLRTWTT